MMETSVFIQSEPKSSGKTQKAFHVKTTWVIEKWAVYLKGDNQQGGTRETSKVGIGKYELQELVDDCFRAGFLVSPGLKSLKAAREAIAATEKSLNATREALAATEKSLNAAREALAVVEKALGVS
jgi:hypothetical protein